MSRRGIAVAAITVALVIGITFVGAWYVLRQTRQVATEVFKPHEEQIDLTALVTRVRALNRLETASTRVVHVSTITQSYEFVPNAMAGDELTFLAAGDVIAGIDLSQLKQEDIRRELDGTVVVRLPPSQVLVTRIDNRESRVINRKTGVFRRADMNLESRARQYAEQGIRNEAVKKGILPLASQNAEVKVAELLHMFGVQRVRCEAAQALPSRG
ncbi:MAG TPA: DUF4230 domain-containing protein [Thermoanaerobaculia bacterium]